MGHGGKVELIPSPKIGLHNTPFQKEIILALSIKTLEYDIESVYNAAKFNSIERAKPTELRKFSVLVNGHVSSHCVYKFIWSHGYNKIGRTDRSLKTRVSKHMPKYFTKDMDETEYPNNLWPPSSLFNCGTFN